MKRFLLLGLLCASIAGAQTTIPINVGQLDDLGEIDGALCGTNEVLEDQGASWACIATPSGGGGGHSNGANCAAGEIPLGVDANGAVEGCYEPAEADITDLSHTVEVNNLGTAVTWANVPDANVTVGSVTQHQAALSITESQISDLAHTSVHGDGANCTAGNYPLGVDANGAVQSCTADADTQLSQEQVEDIAGGMDAGTETRITVTYNDGTGNLDYVVDDMNDDVPESGDFGNAVDLEATGAVSANAVALGTDTTGGYAASTTEAGGASSLEAGALDATTELAGALCGTSEILEDQGASWACIATPSGGGGHSDGANCAAGEIPLGVDANGAVQGCYEPAEADITDLSHTVEVNNLGTAVTWANVPNVNITEASVTQHEAALTVTASQVSDFDTEVSNNSSVTANTAKVTNATHTGDVTGATALTIASGAVDIAMLSATGTPSSSTFLRGDNTWAAPAGGGGGVDAKPCAFTHSGSTNISTTEATIAYDTEVFDPDTNCSVSSGVITLTDAGYYDVDINVPVNDDSTSGATRARIWIFLQKDAGTSTWTTVNQIRGQDYAREASGGEGVGAGGIVSLVAGEAIRVRVDASSSTDVSTESGEASLSIHKIR